MFAEEFRPFTMLALVLSWIGVDSCGRYRGRIGLGLPQLCSNRGQRLEGGRVARDRLQRRR